MLIMRSKNERVELAIRIMRYRELSRRTTDEGFLRPIKDKIAELARPIRESAVFGPIDTAAHLI